MLPPTLTLVVSTSGDSAVTFTVSCSARVAEPFWASPGGPIFRHGFTYSGHPTTCAAGLANLDLIEREDLLGQVRLLEGVLADALAPLADHPMVSEVRAGLGLLAAVEIDPELRAADPGVTERVVAACRERGVLTRGLAGRALQLSPPFVITEPQIARIADTITEALSAVGSAAAAR